MTIHKEPNMCIPRTSLVILTAAILALAAMGADAELGHDSIDTDAGELTIHPIEHATFVMTLGDTVIFVDPVGGEEAFRPSIPPTSSSSPTFTATTQAPTP